MIKFFHGCLFLAAVTLSNEQEEIEDLQDTPPERREYSIIYEETDEELGELPNIGARVSVHYTGRFLNGEIFDSTANYGRAFDFLLGKG